MKKLLCVLLTLFIYGGLFGQTEEVSIVEVAVEEEIDPNEPLIMAEVMPVFHYKDTTDFRVSFKSYVADSIRIPSSTCMGRVFVEFVVECDSTVDNVRILRGLSDCEGYEAEIQRLFSTMPLWIPGKQGGKDVRVKMVVPVEFKAGN